MNRKYVRFKGIYLGDLYINTDYITHVSVYNENPDTPASGIHVIGEKLPIIVKGNPDEVIGYINQMT